MAIIHTPLPLGGRYDHVVFYRLPCGLICRILHPHTRKRILKDPRFAEFRKCSTRMAKASRIASAVYRALPGNFRQFWMYRAFVGEALKMLKDQAMTGEQVTESLFKTYVEVWYLKAHISQAEQTEPRKAGTEIRHNSIPAVNIRRKECKWNDTNREYGNRSWGPAGGHRPCLAGKNNDHAAAGTFPAYRGRARPMPRPG